MNPFLYQSHSCLSILLNNQLLVIEISQLAQKLVVFNHESLFWTSAVSINALG